MKRRLAAVTLLTAILFVGATGGCSRSVQNKAAGEAAAKVNKEEIPAQQVNDLLKRVGPIPPEQTRLASKMILDRLIDQELLVQQARAKKLDRDPRIMQAIETSKRDILARAYMEQVAAAAMKPAEQDIKDYYDKHPELFKERRVYDLREVAINANQDFMPKLQEKMSKGVSLKDLAEWLKEQKVPFVTNAGTKAAEQLPLQILPQFHQLKDGQSAVIPNGNSILVVQVVASKSQPLDLKQATPFIEQYLTNQKRNDLAGSEVKKLRESAKIEYIGDFAKAEEASKPVMPIGGPAVPELPASMTPAAPTAEPVPATASTVPKAVVKKHNAKDSAAKAKKEH